MSLLDSTKDEKIPRWYLLDGSTRMMMSVSESATTDKTAFVKFDDHTKWMNDLTAEYEETVDILSKHVTALVMKATKVTAQRDRAVRELRIRRAKRRRRR